MLGPARRKNAKDTSVVIIGEKSHQVLVHEHVTNADDPITQRHETLGTKRVMDRFEETGIEVKMWVHDNNPTVNKEVNKRYIINQNDIWQGIKNVKKLIKPVPVGPKRQHGKTWHHELEDKLHSRNCGEDAETLRHNLDAITKHYQRY